MKELILICIKLPFFIMLFHSSYFKNAATTLQENQVPIAFFTAQEFLLVARLNSQHMHAHMHDKKSMSIPFSLLTSADSPFRK